MLVLDGPPLVGSRISTRVRQRAGEEVKVIAGYDHVWFMVADHEKADELRLSDYSGRDGCYDGKVIGGHTPGPT